MPTQGCTIKTLITASNLCYNVDAFAHDADVAWRANKHEKGQRDLAVLTQNEYQLIHAVRPSPNHPESTKRLTALCMVPKNDPDEPIVIGFKGTDNKRDIASDINLTLSGTVGDTLRQEAYHYYLSIKNRYPNRQIVLTGHSLGGHIAQYVGVRAFNEANIKNNPEPTLLIRTFNSATIKTNHDAVFKAKPELENRFVCYRANYDVVSAKIVERNYGQVFSLSDSASHRLGGFTSEIPPHMLETKVGGKNRAKNELIEMIRALQISYQARVDGQFFSSLRPGTQYNQIMKGAVEQAIDLLERDQTSLALNILRQNKQTLHKLKEITNDKSQGATDRFDKIIEKVDLFKTKQASSALLSAAEPEDINQAKRQPLAPNS